MKKEYKELIIKCTNLEHEISKMPKEQAEIKKEELKNLKEQLNILRKQNLESEMDNALNKMAERRQKHER